MINTDIGGIEVSRFEKPVAEALETYARMTGGQLVFDMDAAAGVKSTAGAAGYSGISRSFIEYGGERIGNLKVFALAAGDATGHDSPEYLYSSLGKNGLKSYLDNNCPTRTHRRMTPRLTPADKHLKDSELSLSIATIPTPDSDPILFANNLALLGLRRCAHNETLNIVKEGMAGQPRKEFYRIMNGKQEAAADTTTTMGEIEGKPFGNPGAILNPYTFTQVAGVLTLNNGDSEAHRQLAAQLGAHDPAEF